MIHPDTFKTLDLLFRKYRKNSNPFGGAQVILCGDFYQLPPVMTERNWRKISQKSVSTSSASPQSIHEFIPYVFDSSSWWALREQVGMKYVELDQVFLQMDAGDDGFLTSMNEIRVCICSSSTLDLIHGCMNKRFDDDIVVKK